MAGPSILQVGDDQQCPRCRGWHRLINHNREYGTNYESTMLYVTCNGQIYFAGTEGGTSGTPTRTPADPST